MELKNHALQELKNILQTDYGVELPLSAVNEIGVSFLRLTRVSIAVLIRAGEDRTYKNDSIRTSQKQRGSQRDLGKKIPAEKRGALLMPETSVEVDKPIPGLPGREEGIS